MIDAQALIAVGSIYMVGLLSPGPNFLVIAHRSLRHGRAEGLATVAGVVIVNALWASSALFGLTLIFALFPWTFTAIKLVGAGYLIWMGIKLWRHSSDELQEVVSGDDPPQLIAAFKAGLATNLSNAKSMAFYASAFSAAAPASNQTATLWVALGLVLMLAACWYSLVAIALSLPRPGVIYRRLKQKIERAAGTVIIAFGVKLAADR